MCYGLDLNFIRCERCKVQMVLPLCPIQSRTTRLGSARWDDDLYLIARVRATDQCEVHSWRWSLAHRLEESRYRKVGIAADCRRFEQESLDTHCGRSRAQVEVARCRDLADGHGGRVEEQQ